jgi:hypothetical protein
MQLNWMSGSKCKDQKMYGYSPMRCSLLMFTRQDDGEITMGETADAMQYDEELIFKHLYVTNCKYDI